MRDKCTHDAHDGIDEHNGRSRRRFRIYDGVALKGQRVDLVVSALVVVELKAVSRLQSVHEKQVVSYLRTLGLPAGLLINFEVTLLHHGLKRIVL